MTTRISRIVLGFDGSPVARAALGAATEQARLRRVPLHIVTVVDVTPGRALAVALQEETGSTVLREATQFAVDALGDDAVTTDTELGFPADILVRVTGPGDLLVVGSHGHRPVARMLLGSTSSAVATHAHCPVLVVKRAPENRNGPVVVGVDGSTGSVLAIARAADAAQLYGTTLRAVFAVPLLVDAAGYVTDRDADATNVVQAELSECLAGLGTDQPGLTIERSVVHDHPVEALLQEARNARLIVVGSRGRGGLRSLLLGSVSRTITDQASCPVLIVRSSPAKEEAVPVALSA